jgi:hypothetical protein
MATAAVNNSRGPAALESEQLGRADLRGAALGEAHLYQPIPFFAAVAFPTNSSSICPRSSISCWWRLVDFETLREWECFDADTGKDSAREIREYFIPDFSNWKNHDEYQKAFERLRRDLRAKEDSPP